jgi:hypothetical protein
MYVFLLSRLTIDEINRAVEEILADEAAHPSMWPEQGGDRDESPQSPDKLEAVPDVSPVLVPLSPLGRSPGGSVDGTVAAISLRADEDETWLFPSPVQVGKVGAEQHAPDLRADRYERTLLDARSQEVPRAGGCLLCLPKYLI